MQAVDADRPLRGRVPLQRGAVVFEIRWQLHLQRVLNLWRLQERTQKRSSREVCDGESFADEIRAVLPLLLNAIERRCDYDPIPLQIVFPNSMAESIERWKNPEQRSQRAVRLSAHARRQHTQRDVWIVPEQWRHDNRAHRRAKRLVEIVLKRERALSGGGVTWIKGRLG
jgi:hypothetical protein